MSDPFNMVPVLIRPLNEISNAEQAPLDRDALDHCWNCECSLFYVQKIYGLVMFEKDHKPLILPVEHNFYCARCGSCLKHWYDIPDKDIVMTFEDSNEARDAEYLLTMKDRADTYRLWSEDKYKELIEKINEFKKERWGEYDIERKGKNS